MTTLPATRWLLWEFLWNACTVFWLNSHPLLGTEILKRLARIHLKITYLQLADLALVERGEWHQKMLLSRVRNLMTCWLLVSLNAHQVLMLRPCTLCPKTAARHQNRGRFSGTEPIYCERYISNTTHSRVSKQDERCKIFFHSWSQIWVSSNTPRQGGQAENNSLHAFG